MSFFFQKFENEFAVYLSVDGQTVIGQSSQRVLSKIKAFINSCGPRQTWNIRTEKQIDL